MKPFVHDYNAVLLSNHGALSWGLLCGQPCRLEMVEHSAKIFYYVERIGGGTEITLSSRHCVHSPGIIKTGRGGNDMDESESGLLAPERRSRILELVCRNRVLVKDLCTKFGVTGETIRKDLSSLEQEGLLIKTYGGAYVGTVLRTKRCQHPGDSAY